MHSLILVAHPNPKGFAHRIASRYAAAREKLGHTSTILDLYNPENTQVYTRLNEQNKSIIDEKIEKMQTLIAQADEIVCAFPVWWFDCPAILKNWFDCNFTSGFAFKYRPGKLQPEKLLRGKTAKIFATAGSPRRVFWTVGLGMWMNFFFGRFGYVGISLKKYVIFGNIVKRSSEEEREKMLEKVEKIAAA